MAGKLFKMIVKHQKTGKAYMRYFKTRKGYNAAKKAGGTAAAAAKATPRKVNAQFRDVVKRKIGTGTFGDIKGVTGFEVVKQRGKEYMRLIDKTGELATMRISPKGLYEGVIPSPFKAMGLSEKQAWDQFKSWAGKNLSKAK